LKTHWVQYHDAATGTSLESGCRAIEDSQANQLLGVVCIDLNFTKQMSTVRSMKGYPTFVERLKISGKTCSGAPSLNPIFDWIHSTTGEKCGKNTDTGRDDICPPGQTCEERSSAWSSTIVSRVLWGSTVFLMIFYVLDVY